MSNINTNELLARLQALENENKALKAMQSDRIKLSPTGQVSVAIRKGWPITLAGYEWNTLLSMTQEIKDFLDAASKSGRLATQSQVEASRLAKKA